jgi:hypothetical protein
MLDYKYTCNVEGMTGYLTSAQIQMEEGVEVLYTMTNDVVVPVANLQSSFLEHWGTTNQINQRLEVQVTLTIFTSEGETLKVMEVRKTSEDPLCIFDLTEIQLYQPKVGNSNTFEWNYEVVGFFNDFCGKIEGESILYRKVS